MHFKTGLNFNSVVTFNVYIGFLLEIELLKNLNQLLLIISF